MACHFNWFLYRNNVKENCLNDYYCIGLTKMVHCTLVGLKRRLNTGIYLDSLKFML